MHQIDGDSDGSPYLTWLTFDSPEQVVILLMDWRAVNAQTNTLDNVDLETWPELTLQSWRDVNQINIHAGFMINGMMANSAFH